MFVSPTRLRSNLIRITFLFIATIFCASMALSQAQSDAADLRGFVRDQQGAVVTSATVTVRNPANNSSKTAHTNEEGFYQIVNLTPGSYDVTVEATNFKKTSLPAVKLTLGQSADLDVVLEPGQISEVVTITGATTELVETSKTSVATTIDQQRIESLPINERNYLSFALTTSTVGRDNGRPIGPAPTTGLNFGGQRGRSNLVQVDGADNTDNSVNAARSTVSQEAVQEFQVVTNSFAPEFGRSAGGVVNVVTKSGSNDFHGNVFGFIRDKNFQARNPFAPIAKPDFRRTQYGFTLGGPFDRDRTFFFFAFEQRRRDESGFFTSNVAKNLTASATIPVIPGLNPIARTFANITPQQAAFINGLLAAGTPTAICGARAYAFFASSGGSSGLTGSNPLTSPNDGSGCPAISPVTGPTTPIGSRFILSGAPIPVGTTNAAGQFIAFRPLNDLQKVFPVTDRTTYNSFRLDHMITKNHQFNFRFGYNPSRISGIQVESQNQSLGQNDFSRTGIQKLRDFSTVVTLNSTLSNNMVNELRFNFGERRATFTSQNGDAVASNVSGTAFFGRELFSPVVRTETRYEWTDSLSLVAGNHTLKFGGDIAFVRIPSAIFELNFAGLFNFGGLTASTLNAAFAGAPDFTPVQQYGLGFPTSFIQGFGNPVSRLSNRPIAFFAQDSWKARSNLTFNYGVRYDYEFTQQISTVGFRDPLSAINLSDADLLAAQNAVNVQQGFPRDKNNWAPRLAVAWDVRNNAKTVVRAAFGLFYDHPLLAAAFNSDIADAAQQQQLILTAGSPTPTSLLNAVQVFQGTVIVCNFAGAIPGVNCTPGAASSAQYQAGRQRFNDQTFPGFGPVLPFTLHVNKDFEYAYANQGNFTVEQQLGKDMSLSAGYLFVGAHHLPHPLDVNAPRTDLQIQNFQRFFGGALPTSTTQAVAFSIATTAPGTATGVGCVVVIPGMVAACPGGRVVAPAIANFFRPNAPNYFLAQALSGGAVTKAVLDSQIAGSLRTPGVISPFGSVNAQSSDGNSLYNALNVDLKRRFANNFQFLASYTWSHSIDDSSDLQTLLLPQDNRNFRAERADALFDQRHRFVFSAVIASPAAWRSGSGVQRFLADFTVAPIFEMSSGRPFNILSNQDTNNDQSSQTDRPNVLADGTLCVPGAPIPGTTALCTPLITNGVFTSGSLGRNSGITHRFAALDMRLTRAIRFGERVRLDLIAEGFNLFNRFNEGSASPFIDDVKAFNQRAGNGRFFSQPTASFDPRQFQFGLKLSF